MHNDNSENDVMIFKIFLPDKKDFMRKKTLADELEISIDTIDEWIKNGILRENEHYFVENKIIRFYYPAIKLLFVFNHFKNKIQLGVKNGQH